MTKPIQGQSFSDIVQQRDALAWLLHELCGALPRDDAGLSKRAMELRDRSERFASHILRANPSALPSPDVSPPPPAASAA